MLYFLAAKEGGPSLPTAKIYIDESSLAKYGSKKYASETFNGYVHDCTFSGINCRTPLATSFLGGYGSPRDVNSASSV